MIKRIALRTRRHTATRNSVVMALIVSFLAIAFLQSPLGTTKAEAVNQSCPGGFTSGQGSSSCPNLHNSDLLTQRPMPRTLYRGDSRTPFAIFNTGFGGRGANNDIVDHVRGDRAGNSNYVSTSEALGVAVPFARSQGLRNLESAARTRCATSIIVQNASRGWLSRIFPSRCGNQTVSAESYVYEISPTYGRNAVYVPDQIRGNSVLWNHYASQQEWAYVHRIPREAIQGVRVYRMTARANQGLIDTRSITFTYDRYIINPHYGSVTVVYNPNNDANSFFSSTSDLDVPSLPANPYTRGCSAITRCRGGGN